MHHINDIATHMAYTNC